MIRPFRFILLRLMAALLIVQGVAAPAHCLEMLAQATSTPLCSSGDGLHYGQGVPDDGPLSHHGADGCAVCHALPQGLAPQPPALPVPLAVAAPCPAHAAMDARLPEHPVLAYAARGPPFSG